jgi:hypothetical protein
MVMNSAKLPIVALAFFLAASPAHGEQPSFWREACAADTGRFIYGRPAAGGLAMVDRYGLILNATETILETGAAYVELAYLKLDRFLSPTDAVYTQGSGQYVVRLTRSAEPECARQLTVWGYDPATLARVAEPRRGARLNGLLLDAACLSAERIGEMAEPAFTFAPGEEAAYLAQFSAPYRIQKKKENHPLARPEEHVYRESVQIVESSSGRVIAEQVRLEYYTGDYFRPSVSCGPWDGHTRLRWPERVFGGVLP